MKNLKKVLALVVALTMVLGTVSFAFTDVTDESDVYTAVSTLSSLEILKGYEDGTFGPEKDITRSEFAAVVCRALDMESSANGAKGATQFADVPADHWASGYINLAAGYGIINGYPDGNFGPDDNVTYEQAVKMLVVALGFEPVATQKGGYPTGYLVVANQYGMTKDVKVGSSTDAANRGVVAQLTYNALDIPVMEQTGFGTDIELTIQDGKNNHGYKTFLTELDVVKRDGVVMGTAVINGAALEADEVSYKVTEVYGESVKALDPQYNNLGQMIVGTDVKTLTLAEGVKADDYFGLASTIYAKEVKTGKWEVISIMPGEASEIIELTESDIDFVDTVNNEIKYYESDAATRTKTIKLDAADIAVAGAVVLNNTNNTLANLANGLWADDAKVLVINNDDDSAFDMIVGKAYNYDVVEEVEANKDRFTLKSAARTLKFDFEDERAINTILDAEGNEIELADFAEGDVVAYITANNSFSTPIWTEVINLGQNVVEGTVNGSNSADNTISIDGVSYELRPGLTVAGLGLNVGDEGIFFLTSEGYVFDKDTSASISSNYAYILESGYGSASAFADGWQLKLLTKDGTIAVYDMKDTFKVNGVSYGTSGTAISAAVPAQFAAVKTSAVAPIVNHKTNPEARLITYKLDSNNDIKEVTFYTPTANEQFTLKEFKADAQTIDGKIIENGAVVFNISDASMDNAKALDVNGLVDDTDYSGFVMKVDPSTDYTCVVITAGAAAIDYTQNFGIVETINKTQNDLQEDVIEVGYYVDGDEEIKYITVDDDANVNGVTSNAAIITKGDVIMFAADAEGNATDVAVLASYAAGNYTVEAAEIANAITAEEDSEFIFGYIADWRAGNNGRVVTYNGMLYNDTNPAGVASNTDIVIKAGVNAYTFVNNTNATRSSIAVGDWQGDEDIDKYIDSDTTQDTANDESASYFFARVFNGVVVDIIVLGDRITF